MIVLCRYVVKNNKNIYILIFQAIIVADIFKVT